jgi:hypothetical protein
MKKEMDKEKETSDSKIRKDEEEAAKLQESSIAEEKTVEQDAAKKEKAEAKKTKEKEDTAETSSETKVSAAGAKAIADKNAEEAKASRDEQSEQNKAVSKEGSEVSRLQAQEQSEIAQAQNSRHRRSSQTLGEPLQTSLVESLQRSLSPELCEIAYVCQKSDTYNLPYRKENGKCASSSCPAMGMDTLEMDARLQSIFRNPAAVDRFTEIFQKKLHESGHSGCDDIYPGTFEVIPKFSTYATKTHGCIQASKGRACLGELCKGCCWWAERNLHNVEIKLTGLVRFKASVVPGNKDSPDSELMSFPCETVGGVKRPRSVGSARKGFHVGKLVTTKSNIMVLTNADAVCGKKSNDRDLSKSFFISVRSTSFCVTPDRAPVKSGVKVILWNCNGHNNLFQEVDTGDGDGSFYLQHTLSGLCLHHRLGTLAEPGKDCSLGCADTLKTGSTCYWCGPQDQGFCCQKGVERGSCDGTVGIAGKMTCVLPRPEGINVRDELEFKEGCTGDKNKFFRVDAGNGAFYYKSKFSKHDMCLTKFIPDSGSVGISSTYSMGSWIVFGGCGLGALAFETQPAQGTTLVTTKFITYRDGPPLQATGANLAGRDKEATYAALHQISQTMETAAFSNASGATWSDSLGEKIRTARNVQHTIRNILPVIKTKAAAENGMTPEGMLELAHHVQALHTSLGSTSRSASIVATSQSQKDGIDDAMTVWHQASEHFSNIAAKINQNLEGRHQTNAHAQDSITRTKEAHYQLQAVMDAVQAPNQVGRSTSFLNGVRAVVNKAQQVKTAHEARLAALHGVDHALKLMSSHSNTLKQILPTGTANAASAPDSASVAKALQVIQAHGPEMQKAAKTARVNAHTYRRLSSLNKRIQNPQEAYSHLARASYILAKHSEAHTNNAKANTLLGEAADAKHTQLMAHFSKKISTLKETHRELAAASTKAHSNSEEQLATIQKQLATLQEAHRGFAFEDKKLHQGIVQYAAGVEKKVTALYQSRLSDLQKKMKLRLQKTRTAEERKNVMQWYRGKLKSTEQRLKAEFMRDSHSGLRMATEYNLRAVEGLERLEGKSSKAQVAMAHRHISGRQLLGSRGARRRRSWIEEAAKAVERTAKNIAAAAERGIKAAAELAAKAIERVRAWVAELINKIKRKIEAAIRETRNRIQAALQAAVERIKRALIAVKEEIERLLKAAAEAIQNAFIKVKEALEAAFNAALKKINEWVEYMKRKIEEAFSYAMAKLFEFAAWLVATFLGFGSTEKMYTAFQQCTGICEFLCCDVLEASVKEVKQCFTSIRILTNPWKIKDCFEMVWDNFKDVSMTCPAARILSSIQNEHVPLLWSTDCWTKTINRILVVSLASMSYDSVMYSNCSTSPQ